MMWDSSSNIYLSLSHHPSPPPTTANPLHILIMDNFEVAMGKMIFLKNIQKYLTPFWNIEKTEWFDGRMFTDMWFESSVQEGLVWNYKVWILAEAGQCSALGN